MLILIALAQVLLNTVEGMFFPSNIKVCLKSVTAMFIGYIIGYVWGKCLLKSYIDIKLNHSWNRTRHRIRLSKVAALAVLVNTLDCWLPILFMCSKIDLDYLSKSCGNNFREIFQEKLQRSSKKCLNTRDVYSKISETSKMKVFAKTINSFQTFFAKRLYLRCLTRFWMHLCMMCLWFRTE